MLKKNPKYSKRINYEALKDLFVEGGDDNPAAPVPRFQTPTMNLDEKDDMYTIDDPEPETERVGPTAVDPPAPLVDDESSARGSLLS